MNPSLDRVRRRLSWWYVAVFTIVMALFGVAVYTVIKRETLAGLDRSLERAVNQRTRWVLARQQDPSVAARDTTLWERKVVVFDRNAKPISPAEAEPWVTHVAKRALEDSVAKLTYREPTGRTWLLYGKRFRMRTGRTTHRTYVTVAVADVVEIRDRYPSVFTGLVASGIIAVLLAGISGAALARQSTNPIEEAFTQMRRFMGDAAHELKTPIAVLRARTDVALQRPRAPAEYQEALEGISEEARRLGGLVENMLFLARADAGQWPVRREKVFLDDILLDAATAAKALAAEKGVQVEVGQLEEAATRGDPTLIRQLFMILLDNAVHFTPAGGRVRASAARNGRGCRVTIADTGVGIPPDALPHVFDRFFRADSARGRAGAGLGLAIARWIVDMHRARIRVDSNEGRGTTVRIDFRAV